MMMVDKSLRVKLTPAAGAAAVVGQRMTFPRTEHLNTCREKMSMLQTVCENTIVASNKLKYSRDDTWSRHQ